MMYKANVKCKYTRGMLFGSLVTIGSGIKDGYTFEHEITAGYL